MGGNLLSISKINIMHVIRSKKWELMAPIFIFKH